MTHLTYIKNRFLTSTTLLLKFTGTIIVVTSLFYAPIGIRSRLANIFVSFLYLGRHILQTYKAVDVFSELLYLSRDHFKKVRPVLFKKVGTL